MEGSVFKVSSKQNDRWTTQAQPNEPLVLMFIGNQRWALQHSKIYHINM